jgi:PhnB protein
VSIERTQARWSAPLHAAADLATVPVLDTSHAKERPVTSRLNPYISFAGEARQAMEFYKSVFGGELALNTYGESGMAGPDGDKVMHAQLETPAGYTLMASDTPPGMDITVGTNISVSLSGDDADELRGYFEKLADGGRITMPLEKQMWGDEFGMCVDPFGVVWMVNIAQAG